jgi:hypothetical protein
MADARSEFSRLQVALIRNDGLRHKQKPDPGDGQRRAHGGSSLKRNRAPHQRARQHGRG